MSRIVLYIATSLDGMIAGPDDDISWLFRYNDVDYGYARFFAGIGAIIEGRRTYDVEVKNGWEGAHGVPTFVLTHRPPPGLPSREDLHFTDEDLGRVLERVRGMTGKDIWIMGGAGVVRQFLAQRLLDEIVLSIVPTIVGEGVRLFEGSLPPSEWELVDMQRFDKGLAQLTYVSTS
jgi:dihydrofolate reductase